jgi:hypothetical protein
MTTRPRKSQKAQDEIDRQLLEDMLQAARDAGLRVRTERGSFSSGQCVAKGEDLLILNRRLSSYDRAMVLARELAQLDLSTIFLLPKVRDLIDSIDITKPGVPPQ